MTEKEHINNGRKPYSWESDLRECGWDTPGEFLWIYVLGGCGCGESEALAEKVWCLLRDIYKKELNRNWANDILAECLLHWLDSKGLLEHGSMIYSSWLSSEGEELFRRVSGKWSEKQGKGEE